MAGIDDNVAIIGDWVPPSTSPRAFFSSMLVDDIGSRSMLEPPSSNKTAEFFLGSQEGDTNGKNLSQGNASGEELNEVGSFSEYKSNSRGGLVERIAARAGFNAPRLNTESIRSSDLSLNSDIRSPYLTIPPGLSPTILLDSPVFLSNSLAQPSPTTGKFPFVSNGHSRSSTLMTEGLDKTNFFEDINTSFAFKPIAESGSFFLGPTSKMGSTSFPQQSFPSIEVSVQSENSSQSIEPTKVQNQNTNNLQLQADFSRTSTEKDNGANSADPRAFDTVGGSTEHSPTLDEQPDEEGDQRGSGDSMAAAAGGTPSEDVYNWRKYGQKQVKGSEYPRSYYKCTHPNCQVKKKVERSHEGHITEIIYKGAHNHPKPPPNRRSAAIGSSNPLNDMRPDIPEQGGPQSGADGDLVWASTQKANVGAPDWKHENLEVTSSASVGPDYCNQSSSMQAQNGTHLESGDVVDASSTFSNDEDEDDRGTHGSVSLAYDGEGDESESKRRKIEAYATEMSGATRAIREPRVVVQTTSEVDILDDGYRWRKYGQKVVKGNPNPRSYYKCTNAGCTVRKHVERASHDLKSVITTYEGKHNHDVPAARNSSHVNSGPSNTMSGQASSAGIQTHPHRPVIIHFQHTKKLSLSLNSILSLSLLLFMASSSGSLDTSANSHPTFTFSTHPFMTTSFSDLLASGTDEDPSTNTTARHVGHGGLADRIAERTGSGVPKFKSLPPPSLPISPPSVSPSSYFAIPAGLSPAELLDSPVLLSTSNILPSPTTGSFAAQAFWKANSGNNQQIVKQESKNYSDFSFQTQTRPLTSSSTMFQSSNSTIQTAQEQAWSNSYFQAQEPQKQDDFSSGKSMVKPEYGSVQSFSSGMATNIQNISQANGGFQSEYSNYNHQQSQTLSRKSDDGFNWRKYGQKQVKGSENPRSYYKCTYPNCPTKKKVERSLDGQITEIVYKGNHNHPKPQNTRRSSSNSSHAIQASNPNTNEIPDQSFANHGNSQMDSIGTPENSSISMGDDDFEQSSQKSKSGGGDEFDEDEPNAKRWKKEVDNEGISAPGSRTVREPRVVVQTTSDIDILDDGYRWRKYGQKVVKGNPNPRSYYKCTNPGCPVRKHVERASHDLRAVITTYEGKHNHDVPAARGSGSHASVNRALPNNNNINNNNNNVATAMRPVAHQTNNLRQQTSEGQQAPFTLEMLQSPESFGFAGFDNSMGLYMNQAQLNENMFSKTKEEPRDDAFFESLLC